MATSKGRRRIGIAVVLLGVLYCAVNLPDALNDRFGEEECSPAHDRVLTSEMLAQAAALDGHASLARNHKWVAKLYQAVTMARADPFHPALIPVFVVPLFFDHTEFDKLVQMIDVPVRTFVFVWNSDSPEYAERAAVLRQVPHGIVVIHEPTNRGFSGSVNDGITTGAKATKDLGLDVRDDWYFIVNADAEFPRGSLKSFASIVNCKKYDHGLIYGPAQDHFAFAVTRLAVDKAGYYDEVFWPAYMEDIDYRWRIKLAGVRLLVTGINFKHNFGTNRKKGVSEYKRRLLRSGYGFDYGRVKWGWYEQKDVDGMPPSGFTRPFNITGASLGLWVIDDEHRECIRTGRTGRTGRRYPNSDNCFYDSQVLASQLPPRTVLPQRLLNPEYPHFPGWGDQDVDQPPAPTAAVTR
jgi:hypothetical protein